MSLIQIVEAILNGKRVFWKNTGYEVIRDSIGQYLIGFDIGGNKENWIGLTHTDGLTVNGNPEDFFVGDL